MNRIITGFCLYTVIRHQCDKLAGGAGGTKTIPNPHSIVVSGIPSSCGRGRCMETGLHMCSPKSLCCKYLDQHCWSRLHKTLPHASLSGW
ncbi:hypothetical protein AVEN_1762-1 [Araneus ventricosus]|uniref:Uncharacterized protein n=1 Tax=Araneus ventricosus TaxID=182803 RepID=A0A4Y2SFU9_ARAVE|nr:hypothetical protein AVEN_1762-1 [Araneus ventricosus]